MNKVQKAAESVPIFGLAIVALVAAIAVIDVAATVGAVLKLLEIDSIYDRLLPDWTAAHYVTAAVVATLGAKLLSKAIPDHQSYERDV